MNLLTDSATNELIMIPADYSISSQLDRAVKNSEAMQMTTTLIISTTKNKSRLAIFKLPDLKEELNIKNHILNITYETASARFEQFSRHTELSHYSAQRADGDQLCFPLSPVAIFGTFCCFSASQTYRTAGHGWYVDLAAMCWGLEGVLTSHLCHAHLSSH